MQRENKCSLEQRVRDEIAKRGLYLYYRGNVRLRFNNPVAAAENLRRMSLPWTVMQSSGTTARGRPTEDKLVGEYRDVESIAKEYGVPLEYTPLDKRIATDHDFKAAMTPPPGARAWFNAFELCRMLGYRDDTGVRRRLHELAAQGLVERRYVESRRGLPQRGREPEYEYAWRMAAPSGEE